MPNWSVLLIAGVVGSLFASFLRLVWDRRGTSLGVIHPPSRCVTCQTVLRPFDLIPVCSWLWLTGKCRHCGSPLGWGHLAGEITGALLGLGAGVLVIRIF